MPEQIPWAPYQRPLAVRVAVTSGEVIRLDFPGGRFTVNEPLTFVTVNGGPTEVTVTSPKELVPGLGELHTHINLQFPETLAGRTAAVWVMGV
ncbi:MAG: hypothetical protein LBV79_04510 [Candidatus Adiutrix sp.]|jgi:hypothetical protein|nr:hypothetical protein [Candidatus Adiutrix sp.]